MPPVHLAFLDATQAECYKLPNSFIWSDPLHDNSVERLFATFASHQVRKTFAPVQAEIFHGEIKK
jgi:hypothetical protein